MRSLGGSSPYMTGVLYGALTPREDHMKTQGEIAIYSQGEKYGRCLSITILRRIQLCQCLDIGLLVSGDWENKHLLLTSPRMWYSVMAALENKYRHYYRLAVDLSWKTDHLISLCKFNLFVKAIEKYKPFLENRSHLTLSEMKAFLSFSKFATI